jgi:hypothetical protein
MDLDRPYLQDGLPDSSSSYGSEPSLRRYVLAARVLRASYGYEASIQAYRPKCLLGREVFAVCFRNSDLIQVTVGFSTVSHGLIVAFRTCMGLQLIPILIFMVLVVGSVCPLLHSFL